VSRPVVRAASRHGRGAGGRSGFPGRRGGFLAGSTGQRRTQSRIGGGLDLRFVAAELLARPFLPLRPLRAQLGVSTLGIGHVHPVQVGSNSP
jgi:hypothetical protein